MKKVVDRTMYVVRSWRTLANFRIESCLLPQRHLQPAKRPITLHTLATVTFMSLQMIRSFSDAHSRSGDLCGREKQELMMSLTRSHCLTRSRLLSEKNTPRSETIILKSIYSNVQYIPPHANGFVGAFWPISQSSRAVSSSYDRLRRSRY